MQATRKEGKNGFETNETHNQSEDRMVFWASPFFQPSKFGGFFQILNHLY